MIDSRERASIDLSLRKQMLNTEHWEELQEADETVF